MVEQDVDDPRGGTGFECPLCVWFSRHYLVHIPLLHHSMDGYWTYNAL